MKIDWGKLEDFLRYTKNPPLSDNTIKKHARTFKRVSPFIEENQWSQNTILSYIKLKRQEGLLNKSLNDYVKFFRILDMYLQTDYSQVIRRLPEEETEFDVITREEKTAIILCEDYPVDENQRKRDVRMYSVLYYLLSELALRIEEALHLKWTDWKGDYISIRGTKTNRVDDLPISSKLQKAIGSLPKNRERIFPLSQQVVCRELKRRTNHLKLQKRVTTHTFRRSYVTQALDDGIPEQWLIQMTRHSSTSSLKNYQKKAKKYKVKVMQMHSFTVDSMSQEDKINYIRGKQSELEDEMRRLGVTGEMMEM